MIDAGASRACSTGVLKRIDTVTILSLPRKMGYIRGDIHEGTITWRLTWLGRLLRCHQRPADKYVSIDPGVFWTHIITGGLADGVVDRVLCAAHRAQEVQRELKEAKPR
jgi:hypothetical protein